MAFAPRPIKATIDQATLAAVDIRVGAILAAEDVPRSRRLVRLIVDFGDHRRTSLVGMKGQRDLSALLGRQALFVVNLTPKPMAGGTSEAMLLDIGHLDGLEPVLAIPEAEAPNGASAG